MTDEEKAEAYDELVKLLEKGWCKFTKGESDRIYLETSVDFYNSKDVKTVIKVAYLQEF